MSSTANISTDVLSNIFLFLSDRGICVAPQVCKSWNIALEADEFWRALISKRGLPQVEGIEEGLKRVFLNLYPRTINGEMFKECFGEVRDIPRLALERYTMFMNQNDPFALEFGLEQKICRTSWLMIWPSHVFRLYDEKLWEILDASKKKEDKPEKINDGKEMKIPFTANNAKKLLEYPNHRVFSKFLPKELAKCNSPSEKTTLWLMREEAVYADHSYLYQNEFIEEKGFELVPLIVRLAFNGIKIRMTGTCPDKAQTYAHTADKIGNYVMCIGDFQPHAGVHIICDTVFSSSSFFAAAVGMPAEAQTSAVEESTLEKED